MAHSDNNYTAQKASGPDIGSPWVWHPPLPMKGIPVLVFPPRPLEALRWLFSRGFFWSVLIPYGFSAVLTWYYLQPALERSATLQTDWILLMIARNLVLICFVAGGLHLYLYTFARQGATHKFDRQGLARNARQFLLGDQVSDNIFWTCTSGVLLWTAYEVFFMWGYANDLLPALEWRDDPLWFVLLFIAIPFWSSLHFYFVHRWLHWKPLYRLAHALHHKNIRTGPWSGLSMHPLEHLLFYSSVLIHLVIDSHPIHILFHMHWLTLGTAVGHSGFHDLLVKGRSVFPLADFRHQLHHRYFDCNYGTDLVPCDRWFGTYHDGTAEATARMMRRKCPASVSR